MKQAEFLQIIRPVGEGQLERFIRNGELMQSLLRRFNNKVTAYRLRKWAAERGLVIRSR